MRKGELIDKYQNLLDILAPLKEVAVAYSGGVDSTLLSYAACESLTPQKVLLLHAASPLLAQGISADAETIIKEQFSRDVRFRSLSVNPMLEKRFIQNSRERCYVCKRMIYSKLFEEMEHHGISLLLDGTNCDDIQEDRPGFQAISELGVRTPLVEAGLVKREIRAAAGVLGLKNAELPSNSCLATRIECDTSIDEDMLQAIDEMETFLISCGFSGCRVKPRQDTVILEIRNVHMLRLSEESQRQEIIRYFKTKGYGSVMLNLHGRA